jgi:putative copper resistance protein D
MRPLLFTTVWVHLAASVMLVGAFALLLLAGRSDRPTARRWEVTVVAWARLLVLLALVSGIVGLLARTAVFEGRAQAALEPRAVWHAVVDTRPGLIWLARHGLLLVLAAFLTLRASFADRGSWIAARGEVLFLGMLALGLVSGSSHAAAVTPDTVRALACDVVHLLGTGVWVGGLIPLALLLRLASRDDGADARPYAVLTARRFSHLALATMILLMATGVVNALVQVESMAALAGTTHGRLLLAKLAVLAPILALAAVNRRRLLPALSGSDVTVGRPAMRRLAAFVQLEVILALLLLALVAAMTLVVPARHAPAVWPLSFRLSLDALFDEPALRWRALVGSQLAVLGLVAIAVALLVRRRRLPVLVGALALVGLGVGVGLPPIVVDAYPTTYQRPLATYHAASIALGMSVYREHCATCHGASGAGDGPAVQGRQPRPTDLRTVPTSRRHAGEIYWLVTHGIPEHGMPSFAGRLGERERWDVINFIRALGAAGDTRRIGREVEPERPWLIAPDFAVAVGPLAPGALRDYRGRRMVLLVLYTLPESGPRLQALAQSYNLLWIMGVEVIAVPTDGSSDAIRQLGSSPPALFPVVTDGARDIVATYGMFAPGPHTEVLIDRQGYLRAIWSGGTATMLETAALGRQVELLNEEKNVPPFPEDHVH